MSRDFVGYVNRDWRAASAALLCVDDESKRKIRHEHGAQQVDLAPIKAELNYLHTKIMQMQSRKKKGDGL
jgi:hypothetical protein